MTVQYLLEGAQEGNHVDLMALIMFLVFEKEVLQLDDPSDKLQLYFLPKHKERMNKELIAYKEKMNIKYDPCVYEFSEENKTSYILAVSSKQSNYLAYQNMISTDNVRICDPNELMNYNGTDIRLHSIIQGKSPGLLGGY